MAAVSEKSMVILRSTSLSPCPRTEKTARALHAAGWKVRIVGCDRTGRDGDEDRPYAGVTRLHVPAPYGQRWRNIAAKLKWNVALLGWLTHNRALFAVIHATSFDTILPAVVAKWLFGKKLVYDIYDSAMGERFDSRLRDVARDPRLLPCWLSEKGLALVRLCERWAVNRADAVILPDEIRSVFLDGCRPRSVTYIYNSPEPRPLSEATKSDRLRIAYIGLLIPERGLHEMIDVVTANPEFELHIAGFGAEAQSIASRAIDADNVRFHGQVLYERALEISERADVLFSTYNPERPFQRFNTANKLFEALMLGKPFIVSRDTGNWEMVVENDLGMVVSYGDRDELLAALRGIHRMSRDQRTDLARRARRLYDERFAWETMRDRLVSLYSTLSGSEAGCENIGDPVAGMEVRT